MQRKVFTPVFPVKEADKPAPDAQQAPDNQADVTAMLRRLGACELRSSFAQAVFRHMRKNFQSESDFRKTVGQWVANDIATDVQLRMQMQSLGYRPRQRHQHAHLLRQARHEDTAPLQRDSQNRGEP